MMKERMKMSQIIDGKLVSKQVRQRVKEETEKLKAKGITPGLAVIIVGDDPASQVYVKNKEKACDEVGFYSEKYALSENTTQEELNNLVKELNNKKEISGILCQLPLPKHLDDKEVINLIDPIKDVDAFHPVNVGAIMIGDYNFLPCTPAGVMELIHSTGVDVTGKKAVVIGRSNIVGKPMAMLLLHENATVEITHSKTVDLKEVTLPDSVIHLGENAFRNTKVVHVHDYLSDIITAAGEPVVFADWGAGYTEIDINGKSVFAPKHMKEGDRRKVKKIIEDWIDGTADDTDKLFGYAITLNEKQETAIKIYDNTKSENVKKYLKKYSGNSQ